MEQLKFTTRVLGKKVAGRLRQHQVTQTLRSHGSNVVQAILLGRIKVGDKIKVILDNQTIGFVKWVWLDTPRWIDISLADARQGGFDTVADLGRALQRAGFRFQPIGVYKFYRIRFSWVEVKNDKTPLL